LAMIVIRLTIGRHRENLIRLKAGTENRFDKKERS